MKARIGFDNKRQASEAFGRRFGPVALAVGLALASVSPQASAGFFDSLKADLGTMVDNASKTVSSATGQEVDINGGLKRLGSQAQDAFDQVRNSDAYHSVAAQLSQGKLMAELQLRIQSDGSTEFREAAHLSKDDDGGIYMDIDMPSTRLTYSDAASAEQHKQEVHALQGQLRRETVALMAKTLKNNPGLQVDVLDRLEIKLIKSTLMKLSNDELGGRMTVPERLAMINRIHVGKDPRLFMPSQRSSYGDNIQMIFATVQDQDQVAYEIGFDQTLSGDALVVKTDSAELGTFSMPLSPDQSLALEQHFGATPGMV